MTEISFFISFHLRITWSVTQTGRKQCELDAEITRLAHTLSGTILKLELKAIKQNQSLG